MSLLVLCPSYRRPKEARELWESFQQTKTTDTELWIVIGVKDSKDYEGLPIVAYPSLPMVKRTNLAAKAATALGKWTSLGWVADDNRFETKGWDEQVLEALSSPGAVAYGNDMVSPGSKPSHVFMDIRIPKSLGWLVFPNCVNTYFDDCWEALGRGLGTLKYLPEVKIRHLYREKDNADFVPDGEAFQEWVRHGLEDDLTKIRRALRLKPVAFDPTKLPGAEPPMLIDPR